MVTRTASGMTGLLALTMGDPAGIGPEIIVRLCATGGLPCRVVVIGDCALLCATAAGLGVGLDVRTLGSPAGAGNEPGVLYLLAEDGLEQVPAPGRVDARCGVAAYRYIRRAVSLAMAGEVDGIVTAPIHKEALAAAGVPYPGHTEMLADLTGTADYAMMLVNDELRVILVTIHSALRRAVDEITAESELRVIRLADRACRQLGIPSPRVAVAGLNPHAGEGGLFGTEEIDVIAPAIAAACNEGIRASGPHAGDTVFMRARAGEFDIVVAQYHDQGLIPVKYLGLDRGVNITVGLPFVRTSVDHGTAFDIAGRGLADPASLRAAVEQAWMMTRAKVDA